jgi:hypothetical protein
MPTQLRVDGFRVLILFPPREHPPAHVHVVNADGLVVINLAQDELPQSIERVADMKPKDVAKAERIVAKHTAFLLDEFRRIHGKTR